MIVDCLIVRIYLALIEAVMYTEEVPGHDEVKFVHPLLKRYECPICLHAMRSPVQTECGHLFCKECLDPVLQRRRPICPLDQEAISQVGVFPDKACQREILCLQVYCNYRKSGCSWIGALKDLDIHIQGCEYSKEILAVEEENSSASGGYGCEILQTANFSEAEPGWSYCTTCLPFTQNEPNVSSINTDDLNCESYAVPIPET